MSIYDPITVRKRAAALLLKGFLRSGLSRFLARPDLPAELDAAWWETWLARVATPKLGEVQPAGFRLKLNPLRVSSLLVDLSGKPAGFIKVRQLFDFGEGARVVACLQQASGFRVAPAIEWGSLADCSFLLTQPLPRGLTRPVRLSQPQVAELLGEFQTLLEPLRPDGVSPDWIALHGDPGRSNFRIAADGNLWLVDFDDVGWGPKLADWVRFVLAERVHEWGGDRRWAKEAARVLAELGGNSEISESIRFWQEHPTRVLNASERGLLNLLSENVA